MDDLANALWIELRKARRSRVPLFTLLGFLILPLVGALLMVIYKDPEFARNVGLISAKANLVGGSADWPFYLTIFVQGIAIGGFMLFSLVGTWVFGREFADGTLKDLLAVPVSRTVVVLAKFVVLALWCLALTVTVYAVGLVLGVAVGLPQGTAGLLVQASTTLMVVTCLVIVVVMPVALLASVGRGYLAPLGITALILALANVIGLLGWGSYFPWSIPMVVAELGVKGESVEPVSYVVVFLTGLAGIMGTCLWWSRADQSR